MHAGALYWPLERAEEVLSAWRTWIDTVPDSVTSVARLLRFPPIDLIPVEVRGRALVAVEAVCQVDADRADEILAPLRALGPERDTFGPTAVTELGGLHLDPPVPVPGTGDGVQLALLPPEGLAALLATAGPGVDVPLLAVDLRHLGGELEPGGDGGALTGLDAAIAVFAVGITPDPASVAAVHEVLDELRFALAPMGGAAGVPQTSPSGRRCPRSSTPPTCSTGSGRSSPPTTRSTWSAPTTRSTSCTEIAVTARPMS